MLHYVILVMTQRNPPTPEITVAPDDLVVPSHARVEDHLTQWLTVSPSPDARIEAHYLFDDTYIAAHPESVDTRHLALLHALLTAKLLDEGDVIAPETMLAGSCRWPGVGRRRKSLVDE